LPSTTTGSLRRTFRVLVVEDEFLIAMDLNEVLAGAGFEVVGPVGSVEEALSRLAVDRPDAAVLDVSLSGERVTPVAHMLLLMQVPFVLAFLPPDLLNEPILATAQNLGKPTSADKLLAAMHAYCSLRADGS
jgi:DNA-binding response OmpR family regulator